MTFFYALAEKIKMVPRGASVGIVTEQDPRNIFGEFAGLQLMAGWFIQYLGRRFWLIGAHREFHFFLCESQHGWFIKERLSLSY